MNIEEKKENFKAWIALIDDRIGDWLDTLDDSQKEKFDYSIDSLDEIENYMIAKFSIEDLSDQKNKREIDAIASYLIKVFKSHWPNSEYVIELNDKKNVLFNVPAVITNPKMGMAFSPFYFFLSTINLKRRGAFKHMLVYTRDKYQSTYGDNS